MLYTLTQMIYPTYHRAPYRGAYTPLHRVETSLRTDPITALHDHDLLEVGICLHGKGSNILYNRKYEYTSGDIQIVPAGVPHLSKAAEGESARWCWMFLDPLRILKDAGIENRDLLKAMVQNAYCGMFHPWEYPRLADLVEQLRILPMDQGEESLLACAFLVGQLVIECARIGNADAASRSVGRPLTRVTPALDAIRDHYADSDTMAEAALAQRCGMSVSHFRAVFKRETGVGVRQYVIQTRLVAAAHLLKTTDWTVLRIAMDTGFGQVSCFNHSFRQIFGQTPTQFRKRSRHLY